LRDFHWKLILDTSTLKLMVPVLTGYLVLSFCLAAAVYVSALIVLTFIKRRRDENKNRAYFSR
ncbi:MAG TPA: hypothetical protein PK562_05755, partial [Candidatus Omnitrophota bacterium]|nr:hypothetical protein [Candidatus Omnitrophota bacterium]